VSGQVSRGELERRSGSPEGGEDSIVAVLEPDLGERIAVRLLEQGGQAHDSPRDVLGRRVELWPLAAPLVDDRIHGVSHKLARKYLDAKYLDTLLSPIYLVDKLIVRKEKGNEQRVWASRRARSKAQGHDS
jgi:hypothetical protein